MKMIEMAQPQMNDVYRDVGAKLSLGQVGGHQGASIQQSEVQRQTTKLLETAETLDATAAKLIARIEGVTRSEPEPGAKAAEGSLAACPATSLGRTLDSINNRIRATMATLQSTIQRIEL
jgi:hypothetical protein